MIPVIDMHCDTVSVILQDHQQGGSIRLRQNDLCIDLQKLKAGGYMTQSFAMYVCLGYVRERGERAYENGMQLSDTLDAEIGANPDLIRFARTGTEMEKNFRNGILSALKTVEEGAVFEGDPEKMTQFYAKGVRKATLTWNFENELAYPNYVEAGDLRPDTERGLKPAGFEMIRAMEDIGMIIDVSHLNDAGIWDVLRTVRPGTPVIASHSNARAVTGHPRNLTDDMLRAMADRGGITGINYCYRFISAGDPEKLTRIEHMIRHMKHIRNVAGIDMIGLGSDFDGIENPVEIRNASGVQQIADAMSLNGFTDDEIEKVFYRNALRVYKEVLG